MTSDASDPSNTWLPVRSLVVNTSYIGIVTKYQE